MSAESEHVVEFRERVAHINDLQDGKMKQVSINGDKYKVLLSRVDGKYYATSHVCSHYRAPLATGSINSEGIVICPWHGACFNVKTGDIEESPGSMSLNVFKVETVGEDVYVTASESALIQPFHSSCPTSSKAISGETVVIIGGGASGNSAVESLRAGGFIGRIVVISKEPHLPIDRIRLSKSLGLEVSKILLHPESFFEDLSIEFMLGKSVVGVNEKSSCVCLDDGSNVPFNKLLLATGGTPRVLPSLDEGLGNVFVLRSAADSANIAAAVKSLGKSASVVVIGASFIGLEVASTIVKETASVTVIGSEQVPFCRIFGQKIGTAFEQFHRQNGVQFVLNAKVAKFEPSSKDASMVGSVVLDDGKKLEADIVILGIGVQLNTDFLKGSTIPVDARDGSIIVDKYLRVAGTDNIFAAGDIARFPLREGNDNARIEHWGYAQQQGRVAGENIANLVAGREMKEFDLVPFFWTMQYGRSLQYTGHGGKYDDIIIQGDVEKYSFTAFYIKDNKVSAVAGMGVAPAISHASLLFRSGKMLTVEEVRDGKTLLSVPA